MKVSSVFFIITFGCIAIASPLLEKRHTYNFDSCNGDQQNLIYQSLKDMEDLARSAAGNSEPTSLGPTFQAFFGSGDGQQITNEKINTRFHKLAQFTSNVPSHDVTFSCNTKLSCCSGGA